MTYNHDQTVAYFPARSPWVLYRRRDRVAVGWFRTHAEAVRASHPGLGVAWDPTDRADVPDRDPSTPSTPSTP